MKTLWNGILLVGFFIIMLIKSIISTIRWTIWAIKNKNLSEGQAKYENEIDAFSEKLQAVFTRIEA